MANKPSYIGLLNTISVAESAAASVFDDWADATSDKRLEKTLRLVAMREGEHGIAFAKRMLELGYDVREPDEDAQAGFRKIAESSRTEASKLKAMKLHKGPAETDVFDGMFNDKTIDPVTGGLLGRYIAEERDTGWLLKAEYDRLAVKDARAKERAKAKAAAKK
jgi:hypothetical protein